MSLASHLQQFQWALDDEIEAVQSGAGSRTYLSDGHYLGERESSHLYSFSADTELRLPDHVRIDLEVQRHRYAGLLVSIEGFDLVLALEDYLGDPVPTAMLRTEPWFLLEELKKRLEELPCSEGNTELPLQLLGGRGEGTVPDTERAARLLAEIESQLGEEIAYNRHQLAAVGHILANPVSFVWGPPGTGKTKTLGLAVAALCQNGQTVLVTAHSNVAADVTMLSIAKNLHESEWYREGLIIRYGLSQLPELDEYPLMTVRGILRQREAELMRKIDDLEESRKQLVKWARAEDIDDSEKRWIREELARVRAELGPLLELVRTKEKQLVARAAVVGCTLSKATIAPEVHGRKFGAAIVDEASMAYIPHCVFVSSLARERVAVFGDFRQLAPISQSNKPYAQEWLQRDIFDQAGIIKKVNAGATDRRLTMLAMQYRMHSEISSVPNCLYYGGQLRDGPDVTERAEPALASGPGCGKPLLYYDVTQLGSQCYAERESYSRFNLISALVAVECAYWAQASDGVSVGIATPYNAQSRLIHRMLRDLGLPSGKVRVSTVHAFQGSERDVIVFDAVEGEPMARAGKLVTGGRDSTAMRLSNVAISRARGKFVAIANHGYIHSRLGLDESFRRFLDHIDHRVGRQRLRWPTEDSDGLLGVAVPGVSVFPSSGEASKQVGKEIGQAREEVAIAWTGELKKAHFSPLALKRCESSDARIFVSGVANTSFVANVDNVRIWSNASAPKLGLVGIDRKRLWIYMDPQGSAAPVLRLDLPRTTNLLYSFWSIVPQQESGRRTVRGSLSAGESPFGKCPRCRAELWIDEGGFGPQVSCAERCGYSRTPSADDAAQLARVMRIKCERCGGQAQGRKGVNGVFLACANYPACSWTKPLREIV